MAEELNKQFIDEQGGQAIVEGVKTLVGKKVAGFFDSVSYDKGQKKIIFKNGETQKGEIDASDFIKDGMVDNVEITTGDSSGSNSGKQVLKVTFNTEAGKDAIEIPLEGIFNADNYMTKEQVTQALGGKVDSATYNAEKDSFETKQNASQTYQLKSGMGDYLRKDEVEDELEDYVKDEDLAETLSGYVKAEELKAVPTATIQGWFED